MVKRDNHYVPRTYLKRWATDKKTWVYTLLVPHENVPVLDFLPIKGLAYQKNLYVRVKGMAEADDFEVDFDSRFECPASRPLEKLCNGERLSGEEWKCVSEYIASQYVRTPAFYHNLQDFLPRTVENIISELGKKLYGLKEIPHSTRPKEPASDLLPLKFSITDEKYDENHTIARIDTVVGKSMWLFAIQKELRDDSEMMTAMRNMKWSIVTSPANMYWPTSDNPVAIVHIMSDGRFKISRGLANKNSMIVFPVSPTKLLLGKPRNRFDYRFEADMKLYAKIKEVIIQNAFLQVYSLEKDESIPLIRARTIDQDNFNRIHKEFDKWYESYLNEEAPLLPS